MTSNSIAIKVENISKLYRIGFKEEIRSDSAAGALFRLLKSPFRNYHKYRSLYNFSEMESNSENSPNGNSDDILWALKDVSFEVKKGEVIGIVGGNGAGKSTLLKILSKITDPTGGRAEIHGRVSSLLEVGTGFHPELTGRENVYLNGTILGMSKSEVDHKFDEIVDFSGIKKFLDTPVKRYSSGMNVRLAFAVAAHLEPEILLVDEVLAVGDASFQKKCMNKMETVAGEGRTVFLVSHNMNAVTGLCKRALWLEKGQLKLDGNAIEVVKAYLSENADKSGSWNSSDVSSEDIEVKIQSVRVLSKDNHPASIIDCNEPFHIEITYEVIEPVRNLSVTYHLYNADGILIFESMDTDLPELRGSLRDPGTYLATCDIPQHLLKPGRYYISVHSFIEYVKIIERQERILTFEVSDIGYCLNPGRQGTISPILKWNVKNK